MGYVAAINKSIKKGHTIRLQEPANFIEGFGLEGDSHGGRNHRQVSIFGQDSINRMAENSGIGLCTRRFNENIVTEDIRLFELPVGTVLKIGETTQQISQIGKKCFGCEIAGEDGKCTLANEVVFTSVSKGGLIKVGDTIEVLNQPQDN